MNSEREIEKDKKDISKIIIFLSIGIAILGFIIVVIGALMNGWAIFNGDNNLKGFGLILIGNSITLLGMISVIVIMILNIYDYKENGSF